MKYSIFTVMLPEITCEEAIDKLVEYGYDGAEFRITNDLGADTPGYWRGNRCTVPQDTFPDIAEDLGKRCKDAGLEIPSLGTYVSCDDPDAVEAMMDGAAKIGAPGLRVGVLGYDGKENANDVFKKSVDLYGKVEELARQYKVKAMSEIHPGNLTPGPGTAIRFAENFDSQYVGIILDPGNMVSEGYIDWRMGLELLGDYLGHVHVKNVAWKVNETLDDGTRVWGAGSVPLREGRVNWHELMKILKEVGYDSWLSFEDFSDAADTETKLKDNLAYMKGIEEGL